MKSLIFLLVFLFSLHFSGNSQVHFESDFQPGDTSQVHVLTTQRGDRLTP